MNQIRIFRKKKKISQQEIKVKEFKGGEIFGENRRSHKYE